jgi:DNA-binding Lrp family transcriptional regulator
VFGKLEQRILRLYSDVTSSYSILRISQQLQTSYPHVYNKVQELLKKGLMKKLTVGPSHLCAVNLKNDVAVALLTLVHIENRDSWLDRNPAKRAILRTVKAQLDDCTLALFAGDELLIIGERRPRTPPQDATFLTSQQFKDRIAHDPSCHDPVILFGFEAYFRIMRELVDALPINIK